MKVICETSLENFEAWSGGKDTKDALSHSELEKLEQHIEELYPDGMTDTELNDFLWFEREMIAELLGYRNADAMFDQDDDDWEDHARKILNDEFSVLKVFTADELDEMIEQWISEEFVEGMSDDDIVSEFQGWYPDHKDD